MRVSVRLLCYLAGNTQNGTLEESRVRVTGMATVTFIANCSFLLAVPLNSLLSRSNDNVPLSNKRCTKLDAQEKKRTVENHQTNFRCNGFERGQYQENW